MARDAHVELSGLVGVESGHARHVLSVQGGQDTLLHTECPGTEQKKKIVYLLRSAVETHLGWIREGLDALWLPVV